jgi:hypothetical protein
MRETAKFWRLTFNVQLKRPYGLVEFHIRRDGIPGTKAQAARHQRKCLQGMYPSGKLRLVNSQPDRQAEARAEKEAASAGADVREVRA